MTPEKAIELIELLTFTGNVFLYQDDVDAIKLGSEALKWYEKHRPIYPPASLHLLPGETKD